MKPNKTNLNDLEYHKVIGRDRELSQRAEKAVKKLDNTLKEIESKSKKLGETALYNNIPEKLRERKQKRFERILILAIFLIYVFYFALFSALLMGIYG
jgi:hypothetical protein